MHESCKILGLSYGYPTVMLRLSFGKGSTMVRQWVENKLEMERRMKSQSNNCSTWS